MDASTDSTEAAVAMVQIIQDATVPANEGYPQLICETIIAQTVHNLNHRAEQKKYSFLSKPVVKKRIRQPKISSVMLGYFEFCCSMKEHT